MMNRFSYRYSFILFFILCCLFFQQTLRFGKIPVPSDTLIGLYHPWRDAVSDIYPRGMPYKNFLITDPVRQQIPWRKQAIEEIRKGNVPFMNILNGTGAALAGNIQSGSFYPLNIIFFFADFPTAWSVLIMLQIILGGFFFLLFARRLRIHPLAGLLGAAAWTLSGFSISWLTWGTMLQTALWLPLLLLAIDMWREEGKRVSLLLFICSLSMSFLAGHAQIFLYVLLLIAGYAVYRLFRPSHDTAIDNKPQYVFGLLMSVAACIFLTSVQWIPLLHAMQQSARISDSQLVAKEGWFLPFVHLVQIVAPDFFGNPATLNYSGVWNYGELVAYVGVIPLLFILVSLFSKAKDRFFWLGAIGIVLFFILPTPIARMPFDYHIPVFSALQPTRLIFVLCFSFSLLAAYGIDHLLKEKLPFSRFVLFFISTLVLFSIPWLLLVCAKNGMCIQFSPDAMRIAQRNILLPTVFCAAGLLFIFLTRFRRLTSFFLVILVCMTAFDLLRFGWKFTPFTSPDYFFPETRVISYLKQNAHTQRVLAVDDRILPPNTNGYYGIPSVSVYDPLSTYRYEAFIAAMERGKPDISQPFGFNRIVTPKYIQSPLFPHLSASYIVSLQELADGKLVYKEGETHVYESLRSLPLLYPVSHVLFETDEQKIISIMYSNQFIPGRHAVMEKEVQINPVHVGEVISKKVLPDRIEATVVSDGDVVLVLNIQYDPWWSASIDGKKTDIIRTNFAFQGIVVPKGTHTIQLTYGIRFK